ncbi:DUF4403 family protein [Myxococcus stipitatus]|uniref:DUF4403 family protein n=1 Tax=Myxococcus stipitatus TaxID=83455 RepID=UPI0030CCA7EC
MRLTWHWKSRRGRSWSWASLLGLAVTAGVASADELKPALPAPEAAFEVPPIEASTLLVPFSVPLESLRVAANQAIPMGWAEWDAWSRPPNACVKYKVERREVSLTGAGSRLLMDIPGHLWVQGCYSVNNRACVPCGSCDAGFRAPVHADLALNPDWRLGIMAVNGGIRIDDCRITVVNYNVNGRLADVSNPRIDAALARTLEKVQEHLNFKTRAEALWRQANRPLQVREGLWLQLNPKAFRASQPRVDGGYLRATVGMVAEPVLRASIAPPAPMDPPPLPALELTQPAEGFNVVLEARLDFDAASRVLNERLAGQRFSFVDKEHWVKINKASVSGNGSKVVLRLDVEEDIQGTLYLIGTPRYDVERDLLWVDELDYTIETQQAAVNSAEWLMHDRWRASLAKQAQWNLKESLPSVRGDLQAALNKKYGDVMLSGELESLRVSSIFTTSTQCIVRAVARGGVRASHVP